jgi:ribosomal protein S18 acetylase RimI-like enzyme
MAEMDSTTVMLARPDDPAVAPLMAGLLSEYTARYGPGAAAEFERNPTGLFTEEQGGALVLLVEDGETVAGGALRAFDFEHAAKGILDAELPGGPTAEFKRIWTHADYRRRGLGRRVLDELERRAAELGYRQVFLTTGHNQPEAVGLYLTAGYAELTDRGAEARGYAVHPFVKALL